MTAFANDGGQNAVQIDLGRSSEFSSGPGLPNRYRLRQHNVAHINDILMTFIRGDAVPTLTMLIDYDNVDPTLTRAGPVSLAKLLVPTIPADILVQYNTLKARLYGGWRVQGGLTVSAQRLVPNIRSGSPTIISNPTSTSGKPLRLIVELAEGPLGTGVILEETLVRDRTLRKFRSRPTPWAECVGPASNCGLAHVDSLNHNTSCSTLGCTNRLGNIFVRDEQKMVDTLLVADIAHQALVQRVNDVVVVSSDVDMWPGVLLAAHAGCNVIHIHTKQGWRTQRHLIRTLSTQTMRCYQQLSV